MDNSIHNHSAPPFMMSPGDKLFPPPGSFNFSMAALAADPQALASQYFRRNKALLNFFSQDPYQNLFFRNVVDFNSMQSAAAELAGSPQGKRQSSQFTYQSFCFIFGYQFKENKTFWFWINLSPRPNHRTVAHKTRLKISSSPWKYWNRLKLSNHFMQK